MNFFDKIERRLIKFADKKKNEQNNKTYRIFGRDLSSTVVAGYIGYGLVASYISNILLSLVYADKEFIELLIFALLNSIFIGVITVFIALTQSGIKKSEN